MMRSALVLAVSLLASPACSRSPAEPATTTSTPPPASSVAAPSSATTAPGAAPAPIATAAPREFPLLWNDPPHFARATPRSPARAAEYVVPRAGADPEDAECVVMTFGPHQGGTVDENVKRWMDQFHPALPTPRRMTVDVNGMHITFVEVTGTFAGNMMPNRQNIVAPTNKPGWRLIGAIVEAPSGLWFFKMTGPDLTVRAGAREFEDMVRSARPR
jgi:hypothetical protein